MFRNYIKIAYRNLLKNKGFSSLNIIGLAIGMAAVMIITLWTQNQLQYDNFYTHKADLYMTYNHFEDEGNISTWYVSSGPVGKAIQQEYPEVLAAARFYWIQERLISYGDKKIKSSGNQTDESFIKMFDFPLVQGSMEHALDNQNSIVLTETLAKQLFGTDNPIGKIITLDNQDPYTVSSVMEDLPGNTDFEFTFLTRLPEKDIYGSSWNTNTYYTYIQLKPGTDATQFNKKLKPLFAKYNPEETKHSLFLYPMSKMHLYSRFENGIPVGGKIEQIRLIAGIGILILIIACINFINLSTARSQKRAKEVGVRKVVGAQKSSLVNQFLIESLLISSLAGILAIGLTFLTIPLFNQIMDKPISIDLFHPILWIGTISFIFITGFLAGLYPAFVLSRFNPIKTLKGMFKTNKNKLGFREILVIFQFGIAVILLIATLVIRLQIKHTTERNIGYSSAQLLEIPIEGDMEKNYNSIKNELLNSNAASSVTRTGWTITGDFSNAGGNFKWEGSKPEQEKNFMISLFRTDGDLVKTTDIQLKDGRDLDFLNFPADSNSILLNEAAINAMNLKDPVGKQIYWNGYPQTIVGVLNDFIIGSPFSAVKPLLIHTAKSGLFNMIVRMPKNGSVKQNLEKIAFILKTHNSAYPFTYKFVDQEFARKFEDQKQTAQLAMIFSVLAIFISCLGLFGLAAFIAETRIKEIGIRKVLGASMMEISGMLSKDFLKLVLVSIVISIPIAWWAMNKWLEEFTYRINMQWWMFAVVAAIVISIALFTVGFQSIKSALTNPVNSLRNE